MTSIAVVLASIWGVPTGLPQVAPASDICLMRDLGRPTRLAVGPANRVAVHYQTAGKLLLLSGTDLDVVDTVALTYEEARRAGGMGWWDDTLYVIVGGGRPRFKRFDVSGRLLTSRAIRTPAPTGGIRIPAPRSLRSDTLAISVAAFPGAAAIAGALQSLPIVSFNPDSDLPTSDTLALVDVRSRVLSARIGAVTRYRAPPFPAGDLYAVFRRGNGIVLVTDRSTDRPGLVRIGAGGDTVFVVRIDSPRKAVTPVQRDSVRDELYRWVREDSRSDEAADEVLKGLPPIPRYYPSIVSVVSASDGLTWIGAVADPDGSVAWRVYAEDGVQLRQVRMPHEFRVLDGSRNGVWVWDDADRCIRRLDVS